MVQLKCLQFFFYFRINLVQYVVFVVVGTAAEVSCIQFSVLTLFFFLCFSGFQWSSYSCYLVCFDEGSFFMLVLMF